jgi:FixJ family two-component response regulator
MDTARPWYRPSLGYIGPRTVEAHRANLMWKLQLHTQAERIPWALRYTIRPMES